MCKMRRLRLPARHATVHHTAHTSSHDLLYASAVRRPVTTHICIIGQSSGANNNQQNAHTQPITRDSPRPSEQRMHARRCARPTHRHKHAVTAVGVAQDQAVATRRVARMHIVLDAPRDCSSIDESGVVLHARCSGGGDLRFRREAPSITAIARGTSVWRHRNRGTNDTSHGIRCLNHRHPHHASLPRSSTPRTHTKTPNQRRAQLAKMW
jgi:hypothetical protein